MDRIQVICLASEDVLGVEVDILKGIFLNCKINNKYICVIVT